MPEAIIKPTPCVWMGEYNDLPERGDWEIGWTYFNDAHKFSGHELSNKYLRNVQAIRRPITVLCPMLAHWEDGRRPDELHATPFCIDSHPTMEEHTADDHWDVTVNLSSLIVGQKPLITVHPSIHLVGSWPGWLQDGILHQ